MTWYHPALAPQAIAELDQELKSLRVQLARERAEGFVAGLDAAARRAEELCEHDVADEIRKLK